MAKKYNPYEAAARYYSLTKKLIKDHDTKMMEQLDNIKTSLTEIKEALKIEQKA